MALHENEHGNQVEVLADKRVLNLTHCIVHFTCAEAHLECEELTCGTERCENHGDIEAYDYSNHSFAKQEQYVFKIEVSGRRDERSVRRIRTRSERHLRIDEICHVCSERNLRDTRNGARREKLQCHNHCETPHRYEEKNWSIRNKLLKHTLFRHVRNHLEQVDRIRSKRRKHPPAKQCEYEQNGKHLRQERHGLFLN